LPRLARAERAPSGRARCRQCHERIDKGTWRLALHLFEEGRFTSIGCIHPSCAHAYFGTARILDRIVRLTASLDDRDALELAAGLGTPQLAKTQADTALSSDAPAIAATRDRAG
jgi:hypothetical protein